MNEKIIGFPISPEKRSENMITSVRSFAELKDVIDNLGEIPGSDGYSYSADELHSIINRIREGRSLLNRITRSYGLRNKVEELLDSTEVEDSEITNSNLEDKLSSELSVTDSVVATKTFFELEKLIDGLGSVPGSRGENYTAEELINYVRGVRQGMLPLDFITRTHGIRDKVRELLIREKDNNLG